MPSGDIGTLIDSLGYLSDIPELVKISSTIYAVPQRISSSLRVYTFSCDAAGQISNSALDYETLVANAVATRSMFHVSGNVWAIAYVNNVSGSYYEKVVTFTIDPVTGAISPAIANTVITPQGSSYYISVNWMQPAVLPVDGNTMFALFGITVHSGRWMAVKTFTVSNDGVSIAGVALLETAAVNTIRTATPIQLATNYFAAVASGSNTTGHNYLYTYNITNAGAITLIDSLDLGTGFTDSNDNTPGICHVALNVWLITFTNSDGSKTLETIEITEAGAIGAVIDTDASIVPYRENYLKNVANGTFYLVISGQINAEIMRTFAVSGDGTIGAIIDSYSPPSTSGFYADLIWTGIGNMYVGQHRNTTGSTVVNFSITVIVPDPVVETLGHSEVKYNRATLWGNITELGAADSYGFEWSLDSGSFENDLEGTDPIIAGVYILELTGLSAFTSYKYRAYVAIGSTRYYGDTRGFITTYPIPEVVTEYPSSAGDDFINTRGSLNTDGEASSVDKYGIVYGQVQIDDQEGSFGYDDSPEDTGYEDYEEVEATLVSPMLASNAASGQPNVVVVNAASIEAGQTFILTDDDNEEELIVDHVAGTTVTMTTNLVNSYTTAQDAQLRQIVTIPLTGLVYGRRYYYRFYAHNAYGYAYGSKVVALTSDTANLLYPVATASKGIRFCVPGKVNFPPSGMYYDTRHNLLVKSAEAYYDPDVGAFGWVYGKYVCERQYWSEATNVDLYTMSNAWKRTGTIVKVKYRVRIGNNSYGLGAYHKRVINNGASSLTSAYIGSSGNPGWYAEVWRDNPWTSAAWTIEETDALLMGISIRSGTGFEIPLCDCVEGYVLWADAAVVTDGVSNYVGTAARLHGHITEDEADPDCVVYFQWGLTTAYGTTTAEQAGYHKGDAFYADISGLTETEKYHYRAAIKTSAGEIFYGADRVFPTPSYAGVWLGTEADPFQKEITATVLGFRTERGRDEELGHAASGIAELTCDNNGGDYSPERTDGLYVGYLYVGAYLTILDELDDVVYYMFSGRIDSIEPFPEPDNRYAYILAVDGGDDLEVAEIETPLRAVTDEAVLVADVLDAAGWSAGKRSIDAGVDVLQLGWFHEVDAREAINQLEEATRGFFCVDTEGNAIWQSRHYRVTGDRLVSQFTFNETFIKVGYKWSKKNVKNRAKVTGSQYVEWDDDSTLWYAPCNFAGAPFIPAGATVNIWASLDGPRSSSDALVKGNHWNANSQYDKSGNDLSDDITVTPTYYGQAIKFSIENTGGYDAYLVIPDSPPSGAPSNATLLVIGKIYEASDFTVVEEDGTSQTTYGKRTITVEAVFKSNYNDIQSYAQNLVALLKDPLPTPVTAQFNAWTDYPDSTLKLQALTRKLSDRVTGVSAHLGVNQDYYIDKIIHEYVVNEGSWIHLCSFVLSRAEGQAEGQFWILGEVGFSELGETTILGF